MKRKPKNYFSPGPEKDEFCLFTDLDLGCNLSLQITKSGVVFLCNSVPATIHLRIIHSTTTNSGYHKTDYGFSRVGKEVNSDLLCEILVGNPEWLEVEVNDSDDFLDLTVTSCKSDSGSVYNTSVYFSGDLVVMWKINKSYTGSEVKITEEHHSDVSD